MDSWQTSALLLAGGQGIFLSIAMLLPGEQKHRSRFFLGLLLLVLSLVVLNVWGMQSGYHHSPHAFPFWLFESFLLIPPSCWFFIRLNTTRSFQFRSKHWLFYLPALVEVLTESTLYVYNQYTGARVNLLSQTGWWLATEIAPALWMAGVLIAGGRLLLAQARQGGSAASFPALHPARFLAIYILLCVLSLLWIGDAVLQLPVFPAVELVLVLVLFTLSFLSYAQSSLFEVARVIKSKLPVQQAFSGYHDQTELDRLQGCLEQAGLYKRSKLTLEELAGELDLPVRYLSYLINTYHANNFHQFINSWRVQEVIRKIKDPGERHKTLLALALESGFSSKSSFNQVFKTHTGKSPSQYFRQ
ncbi:helix-turn-helix domain-containing protein [Paraflavitalea speifideaquila]|uniref:helix-turn-helix domain-containing protein n=1 Tax=Paraflavitalea speifideaquila TaxID=3076558 RepID=UPI0028ED420A|nr:helix-turn-helix domain-containing protein [Paraflavitalea speifideiaquila]